MSHPVTILFAVLDAFPHDQVSKDLTPTLWSLAQEGGWSREGGRSVLAASTYPNHATFITGTRPSEHQIFTNRAFHSGTLRPAQEVGPRTSTLFQECRAAGRKSLGVFGDQNLVELVQTIDGGERLTITENSLLQMAKPHMLALIRHAG